MFREEVFPLFLIIYGCRCLWLCLFVLLNLCLAPSADYLFLIFNPDHLHYDFHKRNDTEIKQKGQ